MGPILDVTHYEIVERDSVYETRGVIDV